MIRIVRLFYCTVCVILLAAPSFADETSVDVTHYDFRVTLSDETDEIQVQSSIDALVSSGTVAISLDLIGAGSDGKGMTVHGIRVDGSDANFTHTSDRINISLSGAATSERMVRIEISYSGIPRDGLIISTNKHGDRTFFGDHWPNRARNWLSVVDDPSDKATVDFTVIAPDHYQVVASGRLLEETNQGDGTRLTAWSSGVPLATKVMVIGVARFAVDHVGVFHSVPVQSWVYPQEKEKGFYDYEMAWPILGYFVDVIGPFPYEKLANVQSKTIYGGMENAGNIFYHENSIDGMRGSENLFAHEIAHQWFGDSVTEQHFHHVWLSEGFATYFTQLFVEHKYGTAKMNENLGNSRQSIINYADRFPDNPVVDTTVTVLTQLLSTNTYQKGGWVLHMLRREIGDDAFWQGIRTYYAKYRDSNAWTSDFMHVMEDASGSDLDWFFDQWIFTPSLPQVDVKWSYDRASGNAVLDVRQSHPSGHVYEIPIEIEATGQSADQTARYSFRMSSATGTYSFKTDFEPDNIVVDPDTNLLAVISVEQN